MNDQPIVLERLFNAPLSKVWKAITDRDKMQKWYFDLAEFKAEKGFTFQFTGGPDEGRQYLHICEVTDVIPEKKLTYSWRYDGYAGISYVTFELFEQGDKTLLRLTHAGIESFPKENPDLAIGNFVQGWNDIIHNLLKQYLEAV